jgi:hypothetical protein
MAISEKKKITNARSNRKNTTLINIRLSYNTDADILDRLAAVGNKQGYIKRLIRDDIAKTEQIPRQ